MFRSVCLLKVASEWPADEAAVHEALNEQTFRPCSALAERSQGWEMPVLTDAASLCRSVGGIDLFQLRTQTRLLPTSAINEALEARVAEFRERMGEMPGRREMRRLKTETRDKLLPRALLRSERTRACYLRSIGVLAIDAVTPARVERFVEHLRLSLGRLEVGELPLRSPVGSLLTRVFLGDPPAGIGAGRECRMQDPSDSRASIRFADMDLADGSVRRHAQDGMTLTHLGIEFDNVMTCVLDEKGRIGKLRIAGLDADDADTDDPLARFDAELVLLGATLTRFCAALGKALGTA